MMKNEYMELYRQEIIESANVLRERPMPEITDELFDLFRTTGNRIIYEGVYFKRREYLVTFALMSFWFHRDEDISKLNDILYDICEEYCWALPAHINYQSPHYIVTIDLFACETASALSEIITLLGNELKAEVVARVKEEVNSRVLYPFLTSQQPYNWECMKNNWCAVCAGSIGIASIYLIHDEMILHNIIHRLLPTLQKYIDSFEDDGVCLEGLSYFTYGMSFFTAFADLLYEYSNGKMNLLKDLKLHKIALFQQKCYLPKGRTISFSDASESDKFRFGLSSYLANIYQDVVVPPLELACHYHDNNCYRWIPIYRDFLWSNRYIETNDSTTIGSSNRQSCSNHYFQSAQWFIGTNELGLSIAVKGGNNNEPHNHNDIGSFLMYDNGEQIICDLGAGEYTKQYFSDGRYDIFCNQSFGHSVPIIDNLGQVAGEEYRCDAFTVYDQVQYNGVMQELNDASWIKKLQSMVCLEYHHAYPLQELESLQRYLCFSNDENQVELIEKFIFCNQVPHTICERFIVRSLPTICRDSVHLKIDNQCYLFDCKQAVNEIIVQEQLHKNHFGDLETIYTIDFKFIHVVSELTIDIRILKV